MELGGGSDGKVKVMRVRTNGPRQPGGVMCDLERCGMAVDDYGEGRMLGVIEGPGGRVASRGG